MGSLIIFIIVVTIAIITVRQQAAIDEIIDCLNQQGTWHEGECTP